MTEPLTAFWIVPPGPNGPHGFGVTAFCLSDALNVIRCFGYSLPDDLSVLLIQEGVRFVDLDQKHIVPNMGPIVVRGLWYPFVQLGV